MIKPYYQDEWVTIYNADCRDVLPQLPKVDLVLTDPPYGLKWGGTGFVKKNIQERNLSDLQNWDNQSPDAETFQLIKQVSKEQIIWGGNYLADKLGKWVAPILWDKMTGNNPFADGELAWTSFEKGTLRIIRHQWCGAFKDSERGETVFHPTQKPIAVMVVCIEMSKTTGTICDPFMGSGTTLIAAKKLGLKSIGIEIEQKYCDIAIQRLRQSVMNFEIPKEKVEQPELL